jgi:pilus assembly protein CpaD
MCITTPATAKPRGTLAGAVRLLAFCSCAALLAGCVAAQQTVAPSDFDYRLRHKIAIQEGPRTVELFIGAARGGLNGEQRADVLAFANAWRREATGGIVIDVPAGTRNENGGCQRGS